MIKPLDPWNDLEDNYGKGAMKRFTNLKRINPDLKTLVAIGGEYGFGSPARQPAGQGHRQWCGGVLKTATEWAVRLTKTRTTQPENS
jgi:hypothetical protein